MPNTRWTTASQNLQAKVVLRKYDADDNGNIELAEFAARRASSLFQLLKLATR